MHITLSESEYETVMNALLNAQHEFAFLYGLRVTDVPDVRYTWQLIALRRVCQVNCV